METEKNKSYLSFAMMAAYMAVLFIIFRIISVHVLSDVYFHWLFGVALNALSVVLAYAVVELGIKPWKASFGAKAILLAGGAVASFVFVWLFW